MEEPRKKKIRENAVKRWRDHEILKVLNYISVNLNTFEKPTARAYYSQMLDEIKIDATWDLIKWKIRHIKQKYYKAVELQKTLDLECMDNNDNSVQEKILNMCPQFDLLTQIFGGNKQPEYFEVFEPEDSNSQSIVKTENYSVHPMRSLFEITYNEDITTKTNNNDDNDVSTLQQKTPLSADATAGNQEGVNFSSNPAVQATNTTHPIRPLSSSSMFLNSELCLSNLSESERAKYFENMFELEKRKIDIEEYKIKRELEINETKLQHDFEIRKYEIERDERVAKYDIEMRYKYKQQSEYNN